ncbi:CoA transferase [Reticulibacter mediterranei]|uniref:CoA transferase n=1 Tax=Reticulibacter mediterranei TaxID=2778369 RepID=A0A8J3IF56_9CHLR|nr:CaiB/BaiF CoA-transferase family protein [Reticulibacter mediterranei]GHO90477.1 CoA transferase [Reticulibacter mediterranei]
MDRQPGPLSGLRVLELGNLIAAPYAGRIFAEFGAELIKVERPQEGDELRQWRLFQGDTSLFWSFHARNKKSITLDLRKPEGQEIALKLIQRVDVVLENFRPGTLEKWHLGYEEMQRVNPNVILVRISGYGQNGPYRDRPGFASVAEAIGGLRYLTGYPDRSPTRVGVSLGDSLAGLFGVIGALIALLHRERQGKQVPTSNIVHSYGQVVDVALYEAVFAITESLLPEYDGYGMIRQRTGNVLPGLTPSNTYICQENKWVVIGGNADAVFKRLMLAIGQPGLSEDPRFVDNVGRSQHREFLDQVISDWTSQHTLSEVIETMVEAGVPAGPIFDAADIANDPHFQARGMLEDQIVTIEKHREQKHVRFPGIVPKLSETPGKTQWPGPTLGEHNDEIYRQFLGFSPKQIEALKQAKVI